MHGFIGESGKTLLAAIIAALVLGILGSMWAFRRAWHFLARTLTQGRWFDHVRVISKLMRVVWVSFPDYPSLNAARLLVEIEILADKDERPSRFEYRDDSSFQKDLAEWHVRSHDEKDKMRRSLSDLIKLDRQLVAGDPPTIPLRNTSMIDKRRLQIGRYFSVLESSMSPSESFISRVIVQTGFLTPTFLIAGILTRFEQDWETVIGNYRNVIVEETKLGYYSTDLLELRSFEFNCWLLWGPSIPLCRCGRWHSIQPGGNLALACQYGFGDEANSIDLLDWDFFQPVRQQQIRAMQTTQAGYVCAGSVSLEGRIKWGPLLPDRAVCQAQKALRDNRIVLEWDPLRNAKINRDYPSYYYSAYIWVMFVIEKMDNGCSAQPFFTDKKNRWRNLLPFFEHGNIAEARTYLALKKVLAAKVCAALAAILKRDSNVSLRLACTFDESLCDDDRGVMYPPPDNQRIFELMRIQRDTHPDLSDEEKARIVVPQSRSYPDASYSACEMPNRIEEYFSILQQTKDRVAALPGGVTR